MYRIIKNAFDRDDPSLLKNVEWFYETFNGIEAGVAAASFDMPNILNFAINNYDFTQRLRVIRAITDPAIINKIIVSTPLPEKYGLIIMLLIEPPCGCILIP